MALIGSFGDLVFSVSGDFTQTYNQIVEQSEGRWAVHELIGQSPLSEFLGPGQDMLTLEIIFSATLGVDPDESYNILRQLTNSGEVFPLILNGVPLNNAIWYVESINSTSTDFNPIDGKITWRECTVVFKEYE